MDSPKRTVTRAQDWYDKWRDKIPAGARFELEQILLGLPTPPPVPPRPIAMLRRRRD